jgi:parvulin-like peptidyl-prolyl isomerase
MPTKKLVHITYGLGGTVMKRSGKFFASSVVAAVAAVSIVSSASASTVSVSNTSGVTPINISGMDIETALMMVQSERTKLLDAQLQTQIQEVQNRNQLIAELNSQLQVAQQNGDEAAVQKLKSQIDAASNSQQMDMLRLQSMSNKRNEAFDVMTNFIKKMQDSRSSIIGNMR